MKHIFIPLFLFVFFAAKSQDGIVDINFGTSGKQVTSMSAPAGPVYNDFQKIIVIPGGKILHAFSTLNNVTGNYDFALARYEVNGELDLTFDVDGIVMTDFGGDDVATALTVRPDGKIILVGYRLDLISGNRVFAIARYNSDGSLDDTFDGTTNGNGKITTAIGADASAYGVLENGGVTVVVGYTDNGTSFDFAVTRYNNDGTLDNTFDGASNGNGIVTTTMGIVSTAYSIALQNDAKVVVAGYTTYDASSYLFAITRYNIDGTLDNTFDGASNGNGIVTIAAGGFGNDIAYDVAAQSNGKIIAVGSVSKSFTDNDFALVRLNSNGTLDDTFDGDGGTGNGIVTTAFGAGDDRTYAVAIQSDGKIVAAGTTENGGNYDFAIARYNVNGSLDINFNSAPTAPVASGTNVIDFGGDDIGYAVAAQGNYIIFGGRSGTNLATTRLVSSSPILPLNLSSFTAVKQNNVVLLSWQTSTEQNTSYFEVEKSVDGSYFTRIGTVLAAGNSTDIKNYSFKDLQPFPSINFYRLKIVNANQTISYSKMVAVRFNDKTTLQVFPNPVSGMLFFQMNIPAGEVKIRISDATGRTVKILSLRSNGNTTSTSIDMSNLQKGIYFINVNDQTVRVMKN